MKSLNYYLSAVLPQKLYWTLAGLIHPYQAVLENSSGVKDVYQRSEEIIRLLKKFSLIDKKSIVLDIGCGVGRAEFLLQDLVGKCIGVDISPSMIKIARQNIQANNIEFITVNGKNLGCFAKNSFSLVFSILVFQHLPRAVFQNYLQDIYRVLKPKTSLLFQISIDYNQELPEPPISHPWALRYYSITQLYQLLKSAGFQKINFYNIAGNKISSTNKQAIALAVKE